MKSVKNEKPFNWGDAILTIAFLIAGYVMVGTAKNNWILGVGILLMLVGTTLSEENRRRKDD